MPNVVSMSTGDDDGVVVGISSSSLSASSASASASSITVPVSVISKNNIKIPTTTTTATTTNSNMALTDITNTGTTTMTATTPTSTTNVINYNENNLVGHHNHNDDDDDDDDDEFVDCNNIAIDGGGNSNILIRDSSSDDIISDNDDEDVDDDEDDDEQIQSSFSNNNNNNSDNSSKMGIYVTNFRLHQAILECWSIDRIATLLRKMRAEFEHKRTRWLKLKKKKQQQQQRGNSDRNHDPNPLHDTSHHNHQDNDEENFFINSQFPTEAVAAKVSVPAESSSSVQIDDLSALPIENVDNEMLTFAQIISQKDMHGNTPLHLAVMLGQRDVIHLLLCNDAVVKKRNIQGWTVLDEAISYGDRKTIKLLLKTARKQVRKRMDQHRPKLITALRQIPDFEMDLKWEFHSWLPLIKRWLPSDICHIYKKGSSIRVDTTLIDFTDRNWQRGDVTFLFCGAHKSSRALTVLDNELKVYQMIRYHSNDIEDELDLLMSSDIIHPRMNPKGITFSRAQSRWFFSRYNKTEKVGDFEADFYHINGLTIESCKRREHLSEEDVQTNKQIFETLKHTFGDGSSNGGGALGGGPAGGGGNGSNSNSNSTNDFITGDAGFDEDENENDSNDDDSDDDDEVYEVEFKADDDENNDNDATTITDNTKDTKMFLNGFVDRKHRKVSKKNSEPLGLDRLKQVSNNPTSTTTTGNAKPNLLASSSSSASISAFDTTTTTTTTTDGVAATRRQSLPPPVAPLVSWNEYTSAPPGKHPCLARPLKTKESVRHFKATLAMSKEFPMSIDSLIRVLEAIAPFKHFEKLRQFIQLKLPPGFPVKIDIPIVPTVLARVTFTRCVFKKNLPNSLFEVPLDYTEDPDRFPEI